MKRCILMFALLVVTLLMAVLIENTNQKGIESEDLLVEDYTTNKKMLGPQ